jgi:hypothetical protein
VVFISNTLSTPKGLSTRSKAGTIQHAAVAFKHAARIIENTLVTSTHTGSNTEHAVFICRTTVGSIRNIVIATTNTACERIA